MNLGSSAFTPSASLSSEAQGLLEPGRGANGYREYGSDAVLTVAQIRRLLEAGLSTKAIAWMLPCATGPDAALEPCPELLTVLRTRLDGLDGQIDTLVRTRRTLNDYLDTTARRGDGQSHEPCDATTPEPAPV